MSAAHNPGDLFDVKKVRRLIELMKEHDLAEIDLKQADHRVRIKRGGESMPARRVPLAEVADSTQLSDDDMLALDDALDALAKQDPRAAHIVELRFIVGLSLEEIAGVLEIHERTIRRQWLYARAYLLRELGGPGVGVARA